MAKNIRDPELAYLSGRYYLHGRAGHGGANKGQFVMYPSEDGINWDEGVIVSSEPRVLDGYSHNTVINKYDPDKPRTLMVLYSINYTAQDTNSYVFFARPTAEDAGQDTASE